MIGREARVSEREREREREKEKGERKRGVREKIREDREWTLRNYNFFFVF